MPRLEDIRNGNFKVNARTTISHNGQLYRGVDEINELVKRVLPDESEQPNEPKANKAARKLSKSEQRRRDAQQADASPAPRTGGDKPSDAATPPAEPANS